MYFGDIWEGSSVQQNMQDISAAMVLFFRSSETLYADDRNDFDQIKLQISSKLDKTLDLIQDRVDNMRGSLDLDDK